MNTDNHSPDVFCSDLVFDAVKDARESIMALPDDLQGTAFDILIASLERDLGPPMRYGAPQSQWAQVHKGRSRRRAYRN